MSIGVIGIGNPYRRDDGVGAAVVAALSADLPREVRLATLGGETTELLEALRDLDSAWLIDAAHGEGQPGCIERHCPLDTAFHAPEPPAGSTHGHGLATALDLGRVLGGMPKHLVLHTIAGQDFGMGEGLTPSVAASVPALAGTIAAEIAAYLSGSEARAASA